MDYAKIASTIDKAVKNQVEKSAVHIRLGVVHSTTNSTASVYLDGSISPALTIKACSCTQGDRVVVLREKTQFFCIAKVGG